MRPIRFLTLCGFLCCWGIGEAFSAFRHQEGERLQLSYLKPLGTIQGDSLLLTDLQDQVFRFSPVQGEFSYEGGKLRMTKDGETYVLENLGIFMDGYQKAQFKDVNFLIRDETFDLSWSSSQGHSPQGKTETGTLRFQCQGKIDSREQDEKEKFVEACIKRGSTLTIKTYVVETQQPLMAPFLETEKGLIPTHYKDVALSVQRNAFKLNFSTDSFLSLGGEVTGKITHEREKKVLHINIEKASLAGVPFRSLLFQLMTTLHSSPNIVLEEPFIHFSYGP